MEYKTRRHSSHSGDSLHHLKSSVMQQNTDSSLNAHPLSAKPRILFYPLTLTFIVLMACLYIPFSSATNTYDDTEIFFSSTLVAPANIIFLIDNSNSMTLRREPIAGIEDYDHTITYPQATSYRLGYRNVLRDVGANPGRAYLSLRGSATDDSIKILDVNKENLPIGRPRVDCTPALANIRGAQGFHKDRYTYVNNTLTCTRDSRNWGILFSGNWLNWYHQARDTEIYGPAGATRLDVAKEAFAKLVQLESLQNTNVSISFLQEIPNYSPDATSRGGYIALASKRVSDHKQEMIDVVNNVPVMAGTPLGDTLSEVARYLAGTDVLFGGAQFGGNTDPDAVASNAKYKTPLTNVNQCTPDINKSAVILLTDGAPFIDNTRFIPTHDLFRELDPTNSYNCNRPNPSIGSYDGVTCMSEVAKYIGNTNFDKTGGTHTVSVNTVAFAVRDNSLVGLLESTAEIGNGISRSANTAEELQGIFLEIFNETIQQAAPSAAPSTPSSSASRFSSGDYTYFNLFQTSQKNRWDGNLKSYGLKTATTQDGKTILQIVGNDPNRTPIIDPLTSNIKTDSVSRWSNVSDGDSITKGGFRGQIAPPRALYLSRGTAATPAIKITSTQLNNLKPEDFGLENNTAGQQQRDTLGNWMLGINNPASQAYNKFVSDPLHSVPTAVQYDNPPSGAEEIVYFGTNLGILHGVNSKTGQEMSAWTHEDLLLNAKKYYDDIKTDNDIASQSKPYGLDGDITLYHDDVDNDGKVDMGEKALLIVGMRRGGSDYYAIDVNHYENNALAPKLAWRIQGGVGAFANMGQSWSQLIERKIKEGDGANDVTDVLIFTGGYDPKQDRPAVSSGTYKLTDTLGLGIYMVEAGTGRLVWSYIPKQPTAAIPASPAIADVDGDGLADMAITVDSAGRMRRHDFMQGSNFADKVTSTLIADLTITNGQAGDRRHFFAAPAVAFSRDRYDNRRQLSIAVGSGRRPDLLNTVITNHFYVVRQDDVFQAPGSNYEVIYPSDLVRRTIKNFNKSDTTQVQTTTVASLEYLKTEKGYYIQLGNIGDSGFAGEKVLGRALITRGVLLFTTYIPNQLSSDFSCTPRIGRSLLYTINLDRGGLAQVFNVLQAGPVGDIGTVSKEGKLFLGLNLDLGKGDSGFSELSKDGNIPTYVSESFIKFWIERGAGDS